MTPAQYANADRIIQDPAILVGKPVIKGTRIAVDMVLEYLEDNPNLKEFFADYPKVTLADVQACLGYARRVLQETTVRRSTRPHRSRAVPSV